MKVEEIINLMRRKPYMIKQGKGYLSRKLKCKPEDIVEARRAISGFTKRIPKILLFDVETAPMKAFVWGRWNQNISLDATISEWYMLCWSAKWLYSNDIIGDRLTSEEALQENDERIVKHLWQLINEADIVIAYNGKKADIKWMNSRFIVHHLAPPKPYFMVDPCEVARKQFGFSSNKLDALAGYFGIEHKLHTDFQLWKDCVDGNEEALHYMLEYNKVDVKILEEVYIILRPWIINHPNIGNLLSSEEPLCSKCGSEHLELLEGQYYYTNVGKYQLYRCKDCGAISRGRVNLNKGTNQIMNIGK